MWRYSVVNWTWTHITWSPRTFQTNGNFLVLWCFTAQVLVWCIFIWAWPIAISLIEYISSTRTNKWTWRTSFNLLLCFRIKYFVNIWTRCGQSFSLDWRSTTVSNFEWRLCIHTEISACSDFILSYSRAWLFPSISSCIYVPDWIFVILWHDGHCSLTFPENWWNIIIWWSRVPQVLSVTKTGTFSNWFTYYSSLGCSHRYRIICRLVIIFSRSWTNILAFMNWIFFSLFKSISTL